MGRSGSVKPRYLKELMRQDCSGLSIALIRFMSFCLGTYFSPGLSLSLRVLTSESSLKGSVEKLSNSLRRFFLYLSNHCFI